MKPALAAPSSSWLVTRDGAVVRLKRNGAPYAKDVRGGKADVVCRGCGCTFRGRKDRMWCGDKCRPHS